VTSNAEREPKTREEMEDSLRHGRMYLDDVPAAVVDGEGICYPRSWIAAALNSLEQLLEDTDGGGRQS